MKIPGFVAFDNDLLIQDLNEITLINMTFSNTNAPRIISELGLIKEIRYFKVLFKNILKELAINEDKNVAIASPSLQDLIFNLAILCAIQNKNIECVEGDLYYTGQLRRNIHISDTGEGYNEIALEDEDVFYDDELNLEKYEADDLDD